MASRTRASRFTWASFHRCSMIRSLVSWESSFDFWAAAWLMEMRANRRQQHVVRSMVLLVRNIPTCGGRSANDSSGMWVSLFKCAGESYERTSGLKPLLIREFLDRCAEALLHSKCTNYCSDGVDRNLFGLKL